MKIKRLLATLLAIALVVSMCPVSVFATDTDVETPSTGGTVETPAVETAQVLQAGQSVTIEGSGQTFVTCTFTPETSGTYVLYTDSEGWDSHNTPCGEAGRCPAGGHSCPRLRSG